jgi:hypothetical protein
MKNAFNIGLLCFCILIFMLTPAFAVTGESTPASVAGKWQMSWEARIGTESGTMQLDQSDSTLTGTYHGHLNAPKITGTVDGKNITLKLEFQRAHPFTLVFTGKVDGDKMAGKFAIQDVPDAYDWHGENAHPSNYSWSAARQPSQTSSNSPQNQPALKAK